MAGGFSKRGGGIPLGDRSRGPIEQLHGSVEGLRRPPGPDPMATTRSHALVLTPGEAATYRDVEPVHVWVTHPDAADGRVPGLLTGWRQLAGGRWEAWTVHADLADGIWIQRTAWLPAERLEPV